MILYIHNIASNLSSSELKYNESVCVFTVVLIMLVYSGLKSPELERLGFHSNQPLNEALWYFLEGSFVTETQEVGGVGGWMGGATDGWRELVMGNRNGSVWEK